MSTATGFEAVCGNLPLSPAETEDLSGGRRSGDAQHPVLRVGVLGAESKERAKQTAWTVARVPTTAC